MSGWERLAVWGGGAVVGLATTRDTQGRSLVFAATKVGVFESRDLGRSWALLSTGTSLPGVAVVATSPRYAEDGTLYAGGEWGLYRWREGGPGWEHLLADTRVHDLSCVLGESGDLTVLAATGTDGIMVSHDAGRTWAGANAGILDQSVYAVAASPAFARDGLAFAAASFELYRTRNGAQSWRPATFDREQVTVQAFALSPRFTEDRRVLATTDGQGLLRSEDAGRAWGEAPDLAGRVVNAVAFVTADRVLAATDVGVSLSHDGGLTWRLVGKELGNTFAVATLDDGARTILLAGLAGDGIARSLDDGQTWERSSTGLAATVASRLVPSPSFAQDRTLVVASLESGALVSQDGGTSWADSHAGLPSMWVQDIAVVARSGAGPPTVIVAAGGLCLSDDLGQTWRLLDALADANEYRVVAATSADGAICIAAAREHDARASSVFALSEDGGQSWHHPVSLEQLDLGDRRPSGIVSLAFSPDFGRDSTILMATYQHPTARMPSSIAVWRSADRGQTWGALLEEWSGPGPVQIVLLPPNPYGEQVVVGLGGRVLRPMRGAEEIRRGVRRPIWQAAELPDGPFALSSLAASPDYARDRTLFASTSDGVYVSRDGGECFSHWSEGLEPRGMVQVVPSPGYARDRLVFALGLGGTIWRRRDEP